MIGSNDATKDLMNSKNESFDDPGSADTAAEGASAAPTSLTDLIDEMDRAAFRRSLAGRPQLDTTLALERTELLRKR